MYLRALVLIASSVMATGTVCAWSASGHHAIAVLAFDLLPAEQQSEMLRILRAHPEFERHFKAPSNLSNQRELDRWVVGTAGYWPDLARGSDYDRPTWHYQLGASLVLPSSGTVIGDDVMVPPNPGPLPGDATLATRELYIAQAYELCRAVAADRTQPDAERAIAICWLLHLVADGHQPCHAGSLYAPVIFPEGDRGGNSIRQGRGNLHATWDNLLGGRASPSDVSRRVAELRADDLTVQRVEQHRQAYASDRERWLNAEMWLSESQNAARTYVYTAEVLEPVTVAMRGITERVEIPRLSTGYYQTAGRIARVRATQAGYRLATLLDQVLQAE